MGPSGAGKTSLLKVLNGRSKTRLNVESRFYLSRFTPTKTCYITQEVSGHLMPGMTAKQLLIFASRLKNIWEEGTVDHESIALNILNELDLHEARDTMVERCSGGERKRLALGIELTALRMPNLICIDEPTSGLDSNSSVIVTDCLRKLSRLHNLCIITSIHQPNTEVLMNFDDVYVLAKGGVCVYSGHPNEIRQHLTQYSANNDVQKNSSFPIEELIKYSCLDYTDFQVKNLVQATKTKIFDEKRNNINEETQLVLDGIPNNRVRFSIRSIWILILRYFYFIRGFQWIHLSIFPLCLFLDGLVMGLIFDPKIALPTGCINLEDDFNNTCARTEQQRIDDSDLRTNFAYTLTYSNMFLSLIMLQSALMFSKDFIYFLNEHRNGWYSTGAFYALKMIIEIWPLIATAFLFVYEIDIYEDVRPNIYLWMVALIILGSMSIQGAGYLLAILSSGDFTLLIAYFVGYSSFAVLLSNAVTPVHRLHYIYSLLSKFSPYRFVFEALMLLKYGFGRCHRKQLQVILYKLRLTHEQDDLVFCIIMLIFNIIVYRLLAFIVLWIRCNSYQNRRSRADRILDHHGKLAPSNATIPGLSCHQEFTIHQIAI
ncbi:hypothetical protein BLA29_002117 [Euroglyphus maynei]|uniref:ABC transporter domain-containing protein n=1 Tax=Euroglyphus maynei TaxID=6958 RepID=A0A1Y3BVE4_EURMA|nr:hypothetical protein BLA29_002117 [Euroglyphus maynei]